VVLHGSISQLEVSFLKSSIDLGGCFTSWLASFDGSCSFNLRVDDLSQVDLILADKCCGPLVLVSEVVNQL